MRQDFRNPELLPADQRSPARPPTRDHHPPGDASTRPDPHQTRSHRAAAPPSPQRQGSALTPAGPQHHQFTTTEHGTRPARLQHHRTHNDRARHSPLPGARGHSSRPGAFSCAADRALRSLAAKGGSRGPAAGVLRSLVAQGKVVEGAKDDCHVQENWRIIEEHSQALVGALLHIGGFAGLWR
jgi:hypothetical protein